MMRDWDAIRPCTIWTSFVGGLHLTGGLFEPLIPRTVAAVGFSGAGDCGAGTLYRLESNPRSRP